MTKGRKAIQKAKAFQKQLTIGAVYAVVHKRKGRFIGLLENVVPTAPNDEIDEVFLTMRVDVRPGSGQERIAGSPGRLGKEIEKIFNMRPSLVLSIEELPDHDWRLEIRQPEPDIEPEPEPEPGVMDKLKRLIGGGAS